MTTIWLSHFLPYPSTGHGALQRTYHLVRQLARRGAVELYALSNGDGTETDILGMGVARCRLFPIASRTGRTASLLSSALTGSTYWERLFLREDMRATVSEAIARARRAGEVNVLLDTVFLAPYLRSHADVPMVLNHHNVESDLLARRAEMSGGAVRAFFSMQARRTRALESRLAAAAKTNLMVSHEDVQRIHHIAPGARTNVVANGVDVDFFRASAPRTPVPHSLVYAGGMDWFPNRDAITWLATDLWPRLVADEPRRTLTIIGKSPPAEILALAERDSRVKVLGFVPDVRPYIDSAAAYICPIRVGGGTRLKVLDALAMRCPLMATTLSVEGLGLEDGVNFCKADTPDEMVRQLRRLYDDAAFGAALTASGHRLVRDRFSWDVIGEQLATAVGAG